MKITQILYLGSVAYGLVIRPSVSPTNELQPWKTPTESSLTHSIDGHNITQLLLSRDDGQCTDPTFGTSQWADYSNDGNGQYAGTCGVTGHDSHKCWTDVYTVQAQIQWSPWKVVSAGVDCAGSASCSISDTWEFQSCTSQSTSVSVTAGIQSEVLSIGGEVTHESGTTECQTHSSQKTWEWYARIHDPYRTSLIVLLRDNQFCHKVSASYQYIRTWGYSRRTCVTPRGGNPPRRGDGFFT